MNVYDFDNTIYDGESCLDMFFYFLKKDISLIKFMPKILLAFARYKKGDVTIEQAMEKYAPLIESYLNKHPDLLSDTSEFWDKHMKNIKSFYAAIQKPDDLIITASPEDSMREICNRLGIKNYIGTVIESSGKITRLCMRENKTKAFFQAYPNSRIDEFYTDSPENDSALINISEKAFVVKKNKITRIK
ncbi:MAG: haloacid dehalogenase-like hydrolase [Ruminococcus sp.]|nr:haloacid dehalogenase-like hydrolase [Candidatus Copronaster equi]